jgi:hypothetical protein
MRRRNRLRGRHGANHRDTQTQPANQHLRNSELKKGARESRGDRPLDCDAQYIW